MRVCDDNRRLASSMALEVGCTADAFVEQGLTLSCGPLKTALMVLPAGDGSRAAKRHLFGPAGCAGSVQVLLEGSPRVCKKTPGFYAGAARRYEGRN